MRRSFGDIDARRLAFLRHARGPVGGLVLVILCCTVYLPGFFSIPPVDRDESRFAQASRQMFESVALPESERDPELHGGGLAVPRVQGKERLNKPPLIYWLQAGSAAVFTGGDPLADAIWMYRVPSLLAGIITVLATWRIGCSMFDPRAGWLAGALLAVSPVFVWEAHQARADLVMVACTTLAMGQLWKVWKASGVGQDCSSGTPRVGLGLWTPILLWFFVTLGVLTKGPITPMVVGLTVLVLAVLSRRSKEPTTGGRAFHPASSLRWLRATRPLLGLVIVIAGVAPWVYAVAQQVGFGHYWSIIADEVFGRAGSAKEGHWGPPGYHIVLLVLLFWPGSLLTGLSIARAWRRGLHGGRARESSTGRSRSRLLRWWVSLASLRATRRPEVFLLAWFLPTWIVFELVSTKLPHYTMPLYPAVALISARGVCAALSGTVLPARGWRRFAGFKIWLFAVIAMSVGAPCALWFAATLRTPIEPAVMWSIPLTLIGMLWFSATAVTAVSRSRIGTCVTATLVWSVALPVLLMGLILPHTETLWITRQIEQTESFFLAERGGLRFRIVGWSEDSWVFANRGTARSVDDQEAVAFLLQAPGSHCVWLPLDRVREIEKLLVQRAPSGTLPWFEELGSVMGFNYAKGELVAWIGVTVHSGGEPE